MRKLYTVTLFVVIAAVMLAFYPANDASNLNSSSGKYSDDPSYDIAKRKFWDAFVQWHSNVEKGILLEKPIDPSGNFYIDNQGNFNLVTKENPNSHAIQPPVERDVVATYGFQQSTFNNYTSINTTGTAIVTGSCDDTSYGTFPIGFNFTYNGTVYTSFGVNCNGIITMGVAGLSSYGALSSLTNVIVPFNYDLQGYTTGGIYYQTSGSAPNRVLTIEFYNWGFYSLSGNELNFEVKLFETTNAIQFQYKPNSPVSTKNVQVGINSTTADYLDRTGTIGWTVTTAGAANTATVSFTSVYYPPNGLMFQYSPEACAKVLPYGYGFGTTTTLDACWSVTTIAGSAWSLAASMTYPTMSPYQGTIMAVFPSFSSSTANSRLVSPNLNFSGWTTPTLSFYMTRDNGYSANYDSLAVEVSTDGGTTWGNVTSFLRYISTSTGMWEQKTVPLTAYANQNQVKVGLRGKSAYGNNIGLDSVLIQQPNAMAYQSSTTTQTVTTPVSPSTTNNQIIGIQVVTSGATSPFSATSFTLNTAGCTNALNDIQNAKLWYTGTSSIFATTTQFGSAVAAPSGSFSIGGSQVLASGTNYFWLTYDVKSTATIGDVIDAQCNQIVMSAPGGTQVPTVQAPAGSRTIMCSPTIGTGVLTASSYPFNTFYYGNRTQMLYLASEITGASSCAGCGNITTIGFNFSGYASQVMNGFNVNIQNTSQTSLSAFTTTGFTNCYSGTYTVPGTGWQYISLTTPFPWDGTSNLLVEICYGNTSYTSASTVYCTATASNSVAYYYADVSTACSQTTASLTTSRPNINLAISPGSSMSYSSCTTTQSVTSNITQGTSNNQIVAIPITMNNACNPLLATSFILNTSGSTNAAGDITNAKLWYTGTNSTFAATSQFGSTFANPNGSFIISGSQSLQMGVNYFWLTYDISGTSTIGNVVDAQCNQLTVGGNNYVPTVQAPAGSRTIVGAMSGGYYVGSAQPYPTLTGVGGLFDALNNGAVGGNITAYITSDITEPGTVVLNKWTEAGAGNYTLTIVPYTASLKTISGNIAGSLINFNGTQRVTIDGNGGFLDGPRNSKITNGVRTTPGGTKYLLFRNSNGSNPTINIYNGASNITITNCYIESNNNGTLGVTGTIVVGGTSGTSGNNYVTISYNDIRDNSDATGTPVTSLFVSGNVTYPNNNLVIDHNNIYNCYSATQTSVYVYLLDGEPAVQFTNNSMYQTITRAPGNTLAQFGVIMSTSGSSNVVTGNYFGGTAPQCGGSAMTYSDGAGIFGLRIFATGTAAATTVSTNTIANIDYASTYSSLGFFFRGIDVNGNPGGSCNVTNNTIGMSSSIILRFNAAAGASSPNPAAIGFGYNSGVSQSGSVTGNLIGNIVLTGIGTTTGTAFSLSGIAIGSVVTTAINVSGNVIGAVPIQNTLTPSVPIQMYGIYSAAATANPGLNIGSGAVMNLYNGSASTTTNPITAAIYHAGTAGFICLNNVINNITCSGGYAGGITTPTVVGIFDASSSGAQIISLNYISGLSANSVASVSPQVHAITVTSSSSTGTMQRNKIWNLSNTTTLSGAIIGISSYWGIWTCSNNMISVTNGEPSNSPMKKTGNEKIQKNSFAENNIQPTRLNDISTVSKQGTQYDQSPVFDVKVSTEDINKKNTLLKGVNPAVTSGSLSIIDPQLMLKSPGREPEPAYTNGLTLYGVYDDASGWLYYYNTIYVGGTVSAGATNSFSFYRLGTAPTLKDNLLVNARTGGTGKHYCIYSASTLTSNYNVFLGSNASTIALYGAADQTIQQWRTSINNDRQSWSTITSDINPVSLFVNTSTGDLHVKPAYSGAWLVYGKGIAISGQSTDFDGTARSVTIAGGTTVIGAHQVAVNSVTNPPISATEVGGPPASGVTTTYTLWNRSIASISWLTGGTFYPSSMALQYYSGVNPQSVLGGNYSNSYTAFTTTGTLTGTSCNVTYYFGDNETYTISTPSTNTILAKYDPSSWEVFQPGTGVYQSQLTYNAAAQAYSVQVNGIYNFSNFALTDAVSPLPVQLLTFEAASTGRNITLHWVTSHEINNRGFDVERRAMTNAQTKEYSEWVKTGYVDGHGNSSEQQTYSFTDSKMVTGKYQYRLRQIDFNGNFEYYALHNPDVVDLGKPMNADVSQNYPNPSNPKSKIDYQIPFDGKVNIIVYDVIGREVSVLVNEFKEAGYYTADFDGTNLSSGIYFYRVSAEGNGQKFLITKKMVLVK